MPLEIPTSASSTREAISAALKAARDDLAEARRERDEWTERARQLEELVEQLESVRGTNGKAKSAPKKASASRRTSTRKSPRRSATKKTTRRRKSGGEPRTTAVSRVLAEAGEPLTLQQLTDRLIASGRTDDDKRLVSASLSYLARQGTVTHDPEAGTWTVRKD